MSVTRPSESGPLPYIATDEPWVAPEIDGSVHRRSFARRKPLVVVGVTILAIYALVAYWVHLSSTIRSPPIPVRRSFHPQLTTCSERTSSVATCSPAQFTPLASTCRSA